MKNLNEKTFKKWAVRLLYAGAFIFLCYGISVTTFHWAMCGERDRYGVEVDLFLMFCPKEADEWFEKRFWEECTKNDLNLPPNTELLISACKEPAVRGVPGGEMLFVSEDKTGETYMLNLRTGKKTLVPDGQLIWDKGVFLSSELVWLEGSHSAPDSNGYKPYYILDLTDGTYYELLDLSWAPLKDGKFDTQNYEYIKSAEYVFYHPGENFILALAPDFKHNPNRSVILFQSSLGHISEGFTNGELLEPLLHDLGVKYELVDYSLAYADVPSPTGKYIVRHDGIYLSNTNTLVLSSIWKLGFGFRGWYYDESAVVVHGGHSGYLYHSSFTPHVSHPIPLPVLKLNLPSQ
ncbi:MAG TPA: hypothetical protein PLX14_10175 [Anaerolineales bacterium]|nr:hypothetical protein [Anaerolineales bacterium]